MALQNLALLVLPCVHLLLISTGVRSLFSQTDCVGMIRRESSTVWKCFLQRLVTRAVKHTTSEKGHASPWLFEATMLGVG